eukprot:6328630-Alexandrium_andersonii.AAC.1
MPLEGDAAERAFRGGELSRESNDPVGDLQVLRLACASGERLKGMLGVSVNGDRLGPKVPGMLGCPVEGFEAR